MNVDSVNTCPGPS